MSRCIKRPEELSCSLYTKSADLPAEWNALLPAGHALLSPELSVTEQCKLPDLSYLYALIYYNNEPVAAAYFQLLRLQPEHINREMVKPWQHKAWTAFSNTMRPRLLVAGHLFRHDASFFYYSNNISTYHAYQCFHKALKDAVRESCASAVLVKDLSAGLVAHFQNHAPEYLMLRNDISMEMGIDSSWENISKYEKALKHKYAQRFRKVRQQWQGLDIKELSAEEVNINKEKIHTLYKQVLKHQQVKLGILNSDFIVKLKDFHKDRLKVWAVYEKGEMVAFFSAWAKDDVFDMFYIGFDYERNAELQSYFNILFFSVEQAVELRKSKLVLGRTALDAKARLGCEPRYLHTFLYIRNAFIRSFVLTKQQNVSVSEGNWEEKHPFKPAKDQ